MQESTDLIRVMHFIFSIVLAVFTFALTANSFILSTQKTDKKEKQIHRYLGYLGIGGLFLLVEQTVSTLNLFGFPINSRMVFIFIGNGILIYVFYWFIRKDELTYKCLEERFQKYNNESDAENDGTNSTP